MSNTKDFIVELGTEELPPLSLETLAKAFHDNLVNLIDDANLEHQECSFYATPRRLAVIIKQLSVAQPDKTIERQGPAVIAAFDPEGNPTPAATGFAKSCGVSIEQLEQVETNKGDRLSFQFKEQGKTAEQLIPELVQTALNKLPIAKPMRWGDYDHNFIRPVKWLLLMLGDQIVPCTIFSCKSSNITHGHRFLAEGDLTLSTANEYLELLENHYVIADIQKRKDLITQQVNKLAEELNATAVIEPSLLKEVSALVEWPVALAGNFEKEFLSVPQEALISTMSTNQKYFHLKDNNEQLMAKFITISNIQSFNPKAVIAGNEKVIRPRLADAKFFYEQDCKHLLTEQANKLKEVVFQNKLGSIFEKTQRIQSLAKEIASLLLIEVKNVERAATICKSDLVTNMVSEFPSLQGIMGRYYAINDGENFEVSSAMDEIYMPRFAGDKLPSTDTGICLALADRLDTLTGIFAIKQIPTGNKDPFALRRAALGILRILIEKELPLDIDHLISLSLKGFSNLKLDIDSECNKQLSDFFAARLKAMYLDQGIHNTVIQSVQALTLSTPLDIAARIHAVQTFNDMQEAKSLAESNKRVANILNKSAANYNIESVDKSVLSETAEQALFDKIEEIKPKVGSLCQQQQYSEAFLLLVVLKPAIDNFFDTVMVMTDDEKLRQNRLALLNQLRNLFIIIADISFLQK
ncbi:MAG: glycine--tRNA ligase subunit beta [Gammaproteobacteria bacterium]|nr:glycine--tRNA ligase subunit beta [Gammaproteobacteria bacterium]